MSRHINARQRYLGSGDSLDPRNLGEWLAQRSDGSWKPIVVAADFQPVTYVLWNGMDVPTPRCGSAMKNGAQCTNAGRILDVDVYRCGRHGG